MKLISTALFIVLQSHSLAYAATVKPETKAAWDVYKEQAIGELIAVIAVVLRFSKASNLLKTWSGRPGSNRRRPAWESENHLKIKNLAAITVRSDNRKH